MDPRAVPFQGSGDPVSRTPPREGQFNPRPSVIRYEAIAVNGVGAKLPPTMGPRSP